MRKSHGMIARGDEAALANRQGLRNHIYPYPSRFLLFVVSGIRIFEDVCSHKNGKGVLVKSVGVIDATADSVFEVFLNTERQKRYEWDMLMGDLELVETYDGHYDVIYGTYDPKYLTR
ncbi:hypothetical protein D0Y65_041512 [Glycine soja]|uniref:START domain-containing protein n=1 Tax=Glycine soja TaxID=3848 RepID=A0A445GW87_GLYSO|nr:hypothetical protein D0Y65_041512 [Glycine soja]